MRFIRYCISSGQTGGTAARWLLGKEGISYLRERDLKRVIRKHVEADEAEVDHVEGIGALNFLSIDDLKVSQEGELLNPDSVIRLPAKNGLAGDSRHRT